VEVLRSAFRHGITTKDMLHAVNNALTVEEVAEEPLRYLISGPDTAGNMLELVIPDRGQGPALIHAMPIRARYRPLLPGGPRP